MSRSSLLGRVALLWVALFVCLGVFCFTSGCGDDEVAGGGDGEAADIRTLRDVAAIDLPDTGPSDLVQDDILGDDTGESDATSDSSGGDTALSDDSGTEDGGQTDTQNEDGSEDDAGTSDLTDDAEVDTGVAQDTSGSDTTQQDDTSGLDTSGSDTGVADTSSSPDVPEGLTALTDDLSIPPSGTPCTSYGGGCELLEICRPAYAEEGRCETCTDGECRGVGQFCTDSADCDITGTCFRDECVLICGLDTQWCGAEEDCLDIGILQVEGADYRYGVCNPDAR